MIGRIAVFGTGADTSLGEGHGIEEFVNCYHLDCP